MLVLSCKKRKITTLEDESAVILSFLVDKTGVSFSIFNFDIFELNFALISFPVRKCEAAPSHLTHLKDAL